MAPKILTAKPAALRLIIAYKLTRAAVSMVGAAVLAALAASGETRVLHDFAARLNEHTNTALSQELSSLAVSALEPRHFWVALLALIADGAMVALEGVALQRGWRWGDWLVVAMTAALLPFEVVALVRHVALGRLVLLGFNALIVAYLVYRRLRHVRR